jgi:hypothetical protein
MPKTITDPAEALEAGYFGTTHDPIPNDAYTVSGQGPETAAREREVVEQLRSERRAASRDEGESSTSSSSSSSETSQETPTPTKTTSKTSSSSSSSSSESSS